LNETLSVPPVIADREKVTIDEEVLDEVAQKLGEIDREEAIEGITNGTMNPVTIVYFLILDNKMKNILKSQYQNAQNANNNGSNGNISSAKVLNRNGFRSTRCVSR
jgi:predicted thioredoxin/glutaredoxin